jgi:hypothetical protein
MFILVTNFSSIKDYKPLDSEEPLNDTGELKAKKVDINSNSKKSYKVLGDL